MAPRNFDELLTEDRSFIVRGQTFTWRDVRPEILSTLGQSSNGKAEDENAEPDPNEVWNSQDEQILKFLIPEDHERWLALRSREDDPVTVAQFNAVFEYLVEQQTDRPTQTPSPSGTGRGKTGASSKAG